jgi:hypothetical protein
MRRDRVFEAEVEAAIGDAMRQAAEVFVRGCLPALREAGLIDATGRLPEGFHQAPAKGSR